MTKEKKTEVKVGLTVLLAIIIFLLIYGWAKDISLSSDEKFLTVNFPTVAGLEIGDLVSVNGVRKGLVKSIESTNNSATVNIRFSEEVDLREDATFSIMMLDLMGGKKIEIYAGTSSSLLDFDLTQTGKFAGDISTAMATLHSVESDLVAMLGELKTSLEYANSFLGDSDLTSNIRQSMKELNLLANNINDLVSTNKAALTETIANARDLSEQSKNLLSENNEAIGSILMKLDTTLSSSNTLISKLSSMANEVSESKNNIGKLMYDEELLSDLKNSMKQINELTKIINEQLKNGGLKVEADVDLF